MSAVMQRGALHRAAYVARYGVRALVRGSRLFAAVVQQGIGTYRAPSWLRDRAADGKLRWRVVALGAEGEDAASTAWRSLELAN